MDNVLYTSLLFDLTAADVYEALEAFAADLPDRDGPPTCREMKRAIHAAMQTLPLNLS